MRLVPAIMLALASFHVAAADEESLEFFEQKIRPVLVDRCYKCHSAESDEAAAGLRLDTREGSRRGGELGPAVVPGDLKESVLWQAIRYENLEMPPDEKLSDEIIDDFRKWIEGGAADSRTDEIPMVTAPSLGMLLMPPGPQPVAIASPIHCWPNWVAGMLFHRPKT